MILKDKKTRIKKEFTSASSQPGNLSRQEQLDAAASSEGIEGRMEYPAGTASYKGRWSQRTAVPRAVFKRPFLKRRRRGRSLPGSWPSSEEQSPLPRPLAHPSSVGTPSCLPAARRAARRARGCLAPYRCRDWCSRSLRFSESRLSSGCTLDPNGISKPSSKIPKANCP